MITRNKLHSQYLYYLCSDIDLQYCWQINYAVQIATKLRIYSEKLSFNYSGNTLLVNNLVFTTEPQCDCFEPLIAIQKNYCCPNYAAFVL